MNVFLRLFPFHKLRIYGHSMEPTLQEGTVVLVNTYAFWFRSPKKNDIVALYDPRDKKILVKRIIKKDKNMFFVQGDNTLHSTDSREFGMINRRDILGKIVKSLL